MKAIINIGLKKGILDDQGRAIHNALDTLGFSKSVLDVRMGKQIGLDLNCKKKEDCLEEATNMCEKLLANTVIEDYDISIEG